MFHKHIISSYIFIIAIINCWIYQVYSSDSELILGLCDLELDNLYIKDKTQKSTFPYKYTHCNEDKNVDCSDCTCRGLKVKVNEDGEEMKFGVCKSKNDRASCETKSTRIWCEEFIPGKVSSEKNNLRMEEDEKEEEDIATEITTTPVIVNAPKDATKVNELSVENVHFETQEETADTDNGHKSSKQTIILALGCGSAGLLAIAVFITARRVKAKSTKRSSSFYQDNNTSKASKIPENNNGGVPNMFDEDFSYDQDDPIAKQHIKKQQKKTMRPTKLVFHKPEFNTQASSVQQNAKNLSYTNRSDMELEDLETCLPDSSKNGFATISNAYTAGNERKSNGSDRSSLTSDIELDTNTLISYQLDQEDDDYCTEGEFTTNKLQNSPNSQILNASNAPAGRTQVVHSNDPIANNSTNPPRTPPPRNSKAQEIYAKGIPSNPPQDLTSSIDIVDENDGRDTMAEDFLRYSDESVLLTNPVGLAFYADEGSPSAIRNKSMEF